MQQHEAAGAVGVLRHAGAVAGLPEQRRLLIAGDAADDQRLAQDRLGQHAEGVRRWVDVRQDGARHAQQAQQLRVPIARVDVEQHRARRIRRICDVRAVAGELPDEPGIDRAECELAALGAGARPRNLVEQPGDLGAAEIRINHQPGLLFYEFLNPFFFQLRTNLRGAPVLPDDGVVDRLAGLPVPDDGGLALVGDAHAHQVGQ